MNEQQSPYNANSSFIYDSRAFDALTVRSALKEIVPLRNKWCTGLDRPCSATHFIVGL